MARIRTIKPEFFTSEDIVELPPAGQAISVLYESGELPTIAAPELAEPPQG